MIVIDDSVTHIDGDKPIVCWRNAVTPAVLSATYSESFAPPALAGSPTTYDYWQSSETDAQYLTAGVSGSYDYVAIAAHNLGSVLCTVTVEGLVGDTWTPLSDPVLPIDDSPLVFVFPPAVRTGYRLALSASVVAPRIGVLYVGELTQLQRHIGVGHTPITLGLVQNISTGTSASGEFLGRVLLNEHYESQIVQQNVTPDFYRQHVAPWVRSEKPFFFSHRPVSHPAEIGYVWRVGNVSPVNQRSNKMMSVTVPIRGVI